MDQHMKVIRCLVALLRLDQAMRTIQVIVEQM
jgi:hypothetical protein